jgi:hypothetical protein
VHLVQHLDDEKPAGAENEAEEQLLFADKVIGARNVRNPKSNVGTQLRAVFGARFPPLAPFPCLVVCLSHHKNVFFFKL